MYIVNLILLACSLTAALSINYAVGEASFLYGEAHCNFTAESNSYMCKDDSSCPTWFYCNTETGKCQCGEDYHRMIACDEVTGRTAVSNCHCVTYDNVTKETQVGSCYYNCENTAHKTLYDRVYHPLPIDPSESTVNICGRFNRTGTLCGQCAPGLSPFVLSYNLSCVECPDGNKNWWKFVLAGFGPLTFFYIFIVVFNINVTSSRLNGVVLFSQAITMPALARILLLTFVTRPDILRVVKLVFPLYSFWNLDFFRTIIPDVCMNVSTLGALAMDYAIAVYPIFLITLSYILIVLYDREVRLLMYMWRPFHKAFGIFKRNWDIHTSVIDSFTTFFLLSYVKVLSVSSDLLMYIHVYTLDGKSSTRLFYDPTLHYFGGRHLPYAVLALVFLATFVVLPTLVLTLYPFQFFQKFLSLFPLHWHFLHAFVDSFQGCYKDGTEPGTVDCRWFAQLGLFIRLTFFVIYALTLTSMFFIYATLACVLWLMLLVNVNPFKKSAHTYQQIDSVLIVFVSLFYTSILGINIGSMEQRVYLPVMNVIALFSPFATMLYVLYIILHWICSQRRCGRDLFSSMTLFWNQLGNSNSVAS